MVNRNPILVIFIIGVIAVGLANADEGQSGPTVNKHVAYHKSISRIITITALPNSSEALTGRSERWNRRKTMNYTERP